MSSFLNKLLHIVSGGYLSPTVDSDLSSSNQDELDKNLTKACQNKNSSIVEKLILRGANPNKPDSDGYHPLLIASLNGSEDVLYALLKSGVDVDQKGCHGYTALIGAAQKGAHLEKADDDGNTALILATRCCHNDVVQTLLEHGSNMHRKGFMKQSSYDIANENQMKDVFAFMELRQNLKSSASAPNMETEFDGLGKNKRTSLKPPQSAPATPGVLYPCKETDTEFFATDDQELDNGDEKKDVLLDDVKFSMGSFDRSEVGKTEDLIDSAPAHHCDDECDAKTIETSDMGNVNPGGAVDENDGSHQMQN